MVTTTLVLSGVASAALLFTVALTAVGAAFAAVLAALWLLVVYPRVLRLASAVSARLGCSSSSAGAPSGSVTPSPSR